MPQLPQQFAQGSIQTSRSGTVQPAQVGTGLEAVGRGLLNLAQGVSTFAAASARSRQDAAEAGALDAAFQAKKDFILDYHEVLRSKNPEIIEQAIPALVQKYAVERESAVRDSFGAIGTSVYQRQTAVFFLDKLEQGLTNANTMRDARTKDLTEQNIKSASHEIAGGADIGFFNENAPLSLDVEIADLQPMSTDTLEELPIAARRPRFQAMVQETINFIRSMPDGILPNKGSAIEQFLQNTLVDITTSLMIDNPDRTHTLLSLPSGEGIAFTFEDRVIRLEETKRLELAKQALALGEQRAGVHARKAQETQHALEIQSATTVKMIAPLLMNPDKDMRELGEKILLSEIQKGHASTLLPSDMKEMRDLNLKVLEFDNLTSAPDQLALYKAKFDIANQHLTHYTEIANLENIPPKKKYELMDQLVAERIRSRQENYARYKEGRTQAVRDINKQFTSISLGFGLGNVQSAQDARIAAELSTEFIDRADAEYDKDRAFDVKRFLQEFKREKLPIFQSRAKVSARFMATQLEPFIQELGKSVTDGPDLKQIVPKSVEQKLYEKFPPATATQYLRFLQTFKKPGMGDIELREEIKGSVKKSSPKPTPSPESGNTTRKEPPKASGIGQLVDLITEWIIGQNGYTDDLTQ